MPTVLIAEDDDHIRRVVGVWIRRLGHTALEAADGAEAADMLACEDVDLLITDYAMPGMNGPDLVNWWRARCPSRRPVIMLSASCNHEEMARMVRELQITVVPKPFSPSRLMELVGAALKSVRPRPPARWATDLMRSNVHDRP